MSVRYKVSDSQRHLKNIFLLYRTRVSKRSRRLSDTDTSARRHRAFSPCASFLLEEGLASGRKRTPCRHGFRHRVHNNTNTLCLLFPTRAACLSINDLEFWRGKGTKSVPLGYDTLSKTSVRYNCYIELALIRCFCPLSEGAWEGRFFLRVKKHFSKWLGC